MPAPHRQSLSILFSTCIPLDPPPAAFSYVGIESFDSRGLNWLAVIAVGVVLIDWQPFCFVFSPTTRTSCRTEEIWSAFHSLSILPKSSPIKRRLHWLASYWLRLHPHYLSSRHWKTHTLRIIRSSSTALWLVPWRIGIKALYPLFSWRSIFWIISILGWSGRIWLGIWGVVDIWSGISLWIGRWSWKNKSCIYGMHALVFGTGVPSEN